MTGLDPVRDQEITRFLAASGWGGAGRQAMGADWSSRRYERLTRAGATAILMDAPGPAAAQVPPFVRVCSLLRGAGLSAPEIFAEDAPAGLLLLEDYGDATFASLLEGGVDPWPLYAVATDVLAHLHARFEVGSAPDLPRYDSALFRSQVMLFADAYLPAAAGAALAEGKREALAAAWDAVLPPALSVPQGLLLRDYHPGNLMQLPRAGVRGCGLLDVQDAGIGPVSYDLLSLLEDARRDVPPAIQAAMVERYLAAMPNLDRQDFAASYAVMGAVRHARILGRVAQLAAGGRSARQLAFLPRVWGQFAAALSHPALAPVAGWVRSHLPADGAVSRILGSE
ncbi:phosphotransferase [Aerophototrophica crusticola]|uniref:Phosphotransferase n=1 Tax=Aerophototrophica crusticola TaxID=1709002 RepID=A0A858RBF2_9PROT|nr:phosphotransferase [Rhodospirillaceae bacterium B3]